MTICCSNLVPLVSMQPGKQEISLIDSHMIWSCKSNQHHGCCSCWDLNVASYYGVLFPVLCGIAEDEPTRAYVISLCPPHPHPPPWDCSDMPIGYYGNCGNKKFQLVAGNGSMNQITLALERAWYIGPPIFLSQTTCPSASCSRSQSSAGPSGPITQNVCFSSADASKGLHCSISPKILTPGVNTGQKGLHKQLVCLVFPYG